MKRSLPVWTLLTGAIAVCGSLTGAPAAVGAQDEASRRPAVRTAEPSDQGSARGTAVPRGQDQSTSANPAPAVERGTESQRPVSRGGDQGDRRRDSGEANAPDNGPRGSQPRVGRAVPRSSVPPPRDGRIVPVYGGYDPWGLGYGGYYGGYYGAYDPWFGGYPTYYPSSYTYGYEGSLRLKMKPREASVYVDGYYVGIVDDFDGIFQRLHIEAGPHRIEIRAPGFETLAFDVRIEPDHTTTLRGELARQP